MRSLIQDSDDTIFPLDAALALGLQPRQGGSKHRLLWKGKSFALQFADVELAISDASHQSLRWSAIVGFTDAPIRYPLFGERGFFEFIDVCFRYGDNRIEIDKGKKYAASP